MIYEQDNFQIIINNYSVIINKKIINRYDKKLKTYIYDYSKLQEINKKEIKKIWMAEEFTPDDFYIGDFNEDNCIMLEFYDNTVLIISMNLTKIKLLNPIKYFKCYQINNYTYPWIIDIKNNIYLINEKLIMINYDKSTLKNILTKLNLPEIRLHTNLHNNQLEDYYKNIFENKPINDFNFNYKFIDPYLLFEQISTITDNMPMFKHLMTFDKNNIIILFINDKDGDNKYEFTVKNNPREYYDSSVKNFKLKEMYLKNKNGEKIILDQNSFIKIHNDFLALINCISF